MSHRVAEERNAPSTTSPRKGAQLFFVGMAATLTAVISATGGAAYAAGNTDKGLLVGGIGAIIGIIATVLAAWAD